MYLSRILGEQHADEGENDKNSGPLLLFEDDPRLQVGQVIMENDHLGVPGPYIPVFYQECPFICLESESINQRMQQPLAHLYFLTVLEHILSNDWSLPAIMVSATELASFCSKESTPTHLVVLQIELQAVLQVIAKLVVVSSELQTISGSLGKINELFSETITGGGSEGGHGIVVAHHLLHSLKSSRKFIEFMTTKFNVRYKEIECLRPIHEKLKVCIIINLRNLNSILFSF